MLYNERQIRRNVNDINHLLNVIENDWMDIKSICAHEKINFSHLQLRRYANKLQENGYCKIKKVKIGNGDKFLFTTSQKGLKISSDDFCDMFDVEKPQPSVHFVFHEDLGMKKPTLKGVKRIITEESLQDSQLKQNEYLRNESKRKPFGSTIQSSFNIV